MAARAPGVWLCLLLATTACTPEDEWHTVFEDLPAGLLSVWGRSSTDVYAVGGDDGEGPLVLHFDGSGWERLHTGARGDLWWVNGAPGGPIFMGGTGGLILRYEAGAFTRMDTPGDGTVFGIWAASATDAWAVGGRFDRAGFAWRWDGVAWTALDVPELGERGLFKVWGTSADDVLLVGAGGAMLRWDGTALQPIAAGTSRTLFTVHAVGGEAAAVGGAGTGTVVARAGGGEFRDVTPEAAPQMFGVWLTGDGGGYAVGVNGAMLRRDAGVWQTYEPEIPFVQAFHAVWVDETGSAWAVGGAVLASPLSDGMIVRSGRPIPTGSFRP
ncbi:MAG: hypothetical protein KF729_14880 [Sandaracinaceae bacterium]|nr:hypothetical protein [Sandaracinaceae bacterium]